MATDAYRRTSVLRLNFGTHATEWGGIFDLMSVTLYSANAVEITVTSSAGESQTIGAAPGLYTFDWTDLTWVIFDNLHAEEHAFIDTVEVSQQFAVPEPSSAALLALGVLALVAR